MSIGGGFKKGKAEFAMKDIDGHDIKTATESFGYAEGNKVLTVNGIDINSNDSQYGIYFLGKGYEYNIYSAAEGLFFDAGCNFSAEVQFDGGFNITGRITDSDGVNTAAGVTSYGKPAYLSCNNNGSVIWSEVYDVHCWQFRKGPVTLLIYIADWTGNSSENNLFTYLDSPVFDSEFNTRVNRIFNIQGSFTSPYSGNYLVNYTFDRGPGESGDVVGINLTLIGKDSSGAMNVQTLRQEMTSTSFQNQDIKLLF